MSIGCSAGATPVQCRCNPGAMPVPFENIGNESWWAFAVRDTPPGATYGTSEERFTAEALDRVQGRLRGRGERLNLICLSKCRDRLFAAAPFVVYSEPAALSAVIVLIFSENRVCFVGKQRRVKT